MASCLPISPRSAGAARVTSGIEEKATASKTRRQALWIFMQWERRTLWGRTRENAYSPG
ncbi:hypothetical protein llg_36690 [Luteolibacter sp. LG18]|nr:hypothetical protein llg_36690 [Luteolibacter sp. LG18]